ncbi:hypothetical protein HMP0721_1343 [Pseudoramibacter alactolyticus ATCC 23263]|uniref:Uncharacterized protein n=1 Tax=Pseudoramibacter alactolyticus ATCC 23263 TaxID=887929 RepID=E6MH58_9FIRM|nr:hypothetical protein HMP0721_1343 [Pseudoramibacter alactolyticus ATCC 23263]
MPNQLTKFTPDNRHAPANHAAVYAEDPIRVILKNDQEIKA